MQTLGEIQPGQTLGRYEFLVPIAQGGMAAVWAARLHGTRGFSKTVAVKTMLPGISDDPQFEQMFLDEATLASGIRHPNVAQIQDLGEQDDVLYLVMEWVDGEPLSAVRKAAAKRGDGVPRPIAVKIVQDACAGVHAAHELKDETGKHLGLVHRDISPQNILLTYDGVVKIVDFGVAKASAKAEITNAGQIKGKPAYMSPEQALGEAVDRRTDVFALGIILYQLTTGRHPFRGETDMVTLQNIVGDDPITPPRAYDASYPKPLEQVVLKALAKNKEERFQTAAEFEVALDRVFPPNTPRVRTEDVGKLVTDLLGERGEQRREALKEAIRLADERVAGNGERHSLRPLDQIGNSRTSLPSISDTGIVPLSSAEGNTVTDYRSDPISVPPSSTQMTAATPLPKKRNAGVMVAIAVGSLLSMGALAAAAFFFLGTGVEPDSGSSQKVQAVAQPAAVEAPAAQPDEPETAEQSGEAAKADAGTEAVSVEDLEVEKPEVASVGGRPRAAQRPPPKADKPAPEEPKPASKPTPKPSGGFVPPPVTDPGF